MTLQDSFNENTEKFVDFEIEIKNFVLLKNKKGLSAIDIC
jgi:hypothetical protein